MWENDATLHITALKVKSCFYKDICICATTGTICAALYTIIRVLVLHWNGDVQEIEGINSIIKSICTLCPRVSLAVLDARIGTLKQLGLGRKDVEYKWAGIKERYSEVYDEALEGWPGAIAVMIHLLTSWIAGLLDCSDSSRIRSQ